MLQHDPAVLTVILAVKDPEVRLFDVCVASIAGLRNSSRIDLVIVACGSIPEIPDGVRSRLHRVQIVRQSPQGVYPAYNRGLAEVRTPYLMVMGGDDVLLPGLDGVLEAIPLENPPHMVAAAVLMQGIGVKRPSRLRCGLIFRNWCQQGILYRADVFAHRAFDPKYRMQADHKLNMELASDPANSILYRDEVLCHFASTGLSQTVNDWAFREDMPGLVTKYYGWPFGLAARIRRLIADVVKGRRRQRKIEMALSGSSTPSDATVK